MASLWRPRFCWLLRGVLSFSLDGQPAVAREPAAVQRRPALTPLTCPQQRQHRVRSRVGHSRTRTAYLKPAWGLHCITDRCKNARPGLPSSGNGRLHITNSISATRLQQFCVAKPFNDALWQSPGGCFHVVETSSLARATRVRRCAVMLGPRRGRHCWGRPETQRRQRWPTDGVMKRRTITGRESTQRDRRTHLGQHPPRRLELLNMPLPCCGEHQPPS